MKIFAETERLLLREFLPTDVQGMFELDSDPAVHRYLGKKPVQTIEQSQEMIAFIRQQYLANGIGRWAVIIRRYWGQGFATEAAQASVDYGFQVLNLPVLYAIADMQNLASRAVLAKVGLRHVGVFDQEGVPTAWLEARRPTLTKVSAGN
jgi:ribosomal-protein-alanine N-acetyltransferase